MISSDPKNCPNCKSPFVYVMTREEGKNVYRCSRCSHEWRDNDQ